MGKITNHFFKVQASLKYRDVEEGYDVYFSRYYGLHIANFGKYLGLTPTNLTTLSVFVGMIGGGLLYFQDQIGIIVVAAILIILAGVLDSADGQLARMTEQTSEFGRILDGIADSLVFIACYVGGTTYLAFTPEGHLWYILLASVSGYIHNLKNGVYDFYKNEFLYYCGEKDEARVFAPYEIKQRKKARSGRFEKLAYLLYYDYVRRQFKFNSRSKKTLTAFRGYFENNKTKGKFQKLYYENHKPILVWWSWTAGLNVFRWGIIISALFGRFDIFLWVGLISSVGYLYALHLEKRGDDKILAAMA